MNRDPQNGTKGGPDSPLGRGGLGAPPEPSLEGGSRAPLEGCPGGPCAPPSSRLPCQLRTVTGNEFLLQSDQEATIQEWARAIRGVIRRLVSAWTGAGAAPWLPPAPLASPTVPVHHTPRQDLENPVDAPVGWLHQGDIEDLVELSGDEDEAPRVTEGAGAPGRVGGLRRGAGLRRDCDRDYTLDLLCPQVSPMPPTPRRRSG